MEVEMTHLRTRRLHKNQTAPTRRCFTHRNDRDGKEKAIARTQRQATGVTQEQAIGRNP
jgi:hypothetical protein